MVPTPFTVADPLVVLMVPFLGEKELVFNIVIPGINLTVLVALNSLFPSKLISASALSVLLLTLIAAPEYPLASFLKLNAAEALVVIPTLLSGF